MDIEWEQSTARLRTRSQYLQTEKSTTDTLLTGLSSARPQKAKYWKDIQEVSDLESTDWKRVAWALGNDNDI